MKHQHLEAYISDLLQETDCVVVPDFGGFVLNRQGARHVAQQYLVRPPAKVVSYNRSLQKNDGLLAQYISRVDEIDYADAMKYISAEVSTWKKILKDKSKTYLPTLGTITSDSEQRYSFHPDHALNYLPASYGLTAVQLTPLERLAANTKDEKVKPLIPAQNNWISTAASVAAMLLLVTYIFLSGKMEDPFAAGQATTISVPHENTVESIAGIIHDTVASPSTYSSVEYDFYIIGGSFLSAENAQKFAEDLRQDGYNSIILDNEAGFHRVAYQMEQDSVSAGLMLDKIKTQENQAAWILKW